MQMELPKEELTAFWASGEPEREPDDYMSLARRLDGTLTREQSALLVKMLDAFGALVRYERRWYFHKGYEAAKKETR